MAPLCKSKLCLFITKKTTILHGIKIIHLTFNISFKDKNIFSYVQKCKKNLRFITFTVTLLILKRQKINVENF